MLPPTTSHVDQGGEDRRARGHLHLRRPRQPRAAAASSASSTCCPSIGGKAPTRSGKKRDIAATTLEPPLGSGAYRIKEFVAGRTRRLRARRRTIGARISTSISGATISTSCATNISAIPRSRSKPSRAITIDWRIENSAKNWATAYDFPAVKDKRVHAGGIPDRATAA